MLESPRHNHIASWHGRLAGLMIDDETIGLSTLHIAQDDAESEEDGHRLDDE